MRKKIMAEKFIQEATKKNKGLLRKKLGAKEGQPIAAKKLEKAEHSKNPKLKKEAVLAETLRKISRKK